MLNYSPPRNFHFRGGQKTILSTLYWRYRPEDNIRLDEVDWESELQTLQMETPEEQGLYARNEPQNEREGPTRLSIGDLDDQPTPFSSQSGTQRSRAMKRKSVEDRQKGLVTKAKFKAMEKYRQSLRASRASKTSSLLGERTGQDVLSGSHEGRKTNLSEPKDDEPAVSSKGPKLPVREKAPTEQWSTEELVPQWYADLDINFADEYGLLGNCMRVRTRRAPYIHIGGP